MMDLKNIRICIVGLGYVGLPLAVAFSEKFSVVGFDIDEYRVNELRKGRDKTLEVTPDVLASAKLLSYTNNPGDLKECNFFIITVPTPVDGHNIPDFKSLISASEVISKVLKKGDYVVYESTVYPGATESECVPVLEKFSGFSLNKDFFVGYSPERINPGDKQRSVTTITKIVSGSTPQATDFIDSVYKKIIKAGTYKASSIKVAEAAKVIENTQRDVNIALVNELAMIFEKMGIKSKEVLDAASTKWNFLPFKPGLVGGHCIGVDPYYLTHIAQYLGYYPEIILASRRINNRMSEYVVSRLLMEMTRKKIHLNGSKILMMGLTFKENCPDLRNTRVVEVVELLKEIGADVQIYDPWVTSAESFHEYGVNVIDYPEVHAYDAVVVAVAHDQFVEMGVNIKKFLKSHHVVFDLKSILPDNLSDLSL